jgi:hypothetical protein
VTLIEGEQDDRAELAAEDQAIRDAETGKEPDPPGQVVTAIPKLIEDLFRDPQTLQRSQEG